MRRTKHGSDLALTVQSGESRDGILLSSSEIKYKRGLEQTQ